MQKKLPREFYTRTDVTEIARDLLGKVLVSKVDDIITSGIIVETEAYRSNDKACHAFQKKKTKRNSIMFEEGGVAYIFMNYGIHYLFNVVTNIINEPDAVLIRALQPLKGTETMKLRRKKLTDARITSGPGALSKAMGIDLRLNGKSLLENIIWIEENDSINIRNLRVISSRRIGIDYAGEHAMLPWRYYIKDNPWVSKL